ncbi:DUF4232 domain-containing protein [Streptomyces olivoreticuli]|uniref:DUF4232 domain-containing protein n=1 Tax=Streptomyces olivoreticuli TaxID=68246 RepID=UPI00265B47EA|nr:DUF4232 domain-containing protein [Streptomyces olivoreticuli]WKK20874.1 DUF4232 domain-containing protein [Streptomyces olivoreticuli]
MTRTRTLRLAAAALTTAAALTLTACGGSDGSGAKTSGKADTSATGGQEQGQEQGQSEDPGQTDAAQTASSAKNGKADKGTCTSANVKVEAKAVQSPINHMLLVVTNTSKAPCHAYNFPFVRFDADQATAGVVEESRPQAVTTLAPGKSAYAAVITSAADGSGGAGREAKKLAVSFQGKDGNGSIGDQVSVALPGGKVHVDDSARVTYWQSEQSAALTW